MSLKHDYQEWLKNASEETFIKAFNYSQFSQGKMDSFLWKEFIASTHDIADDDGYWYIDTGCAQFRFQPFDGCDAMTGLAYDNTIRDVIRCVFLMTPQPKAREWIEHHVSTVVEGSSAEVDTMAKFKVYSKALLEFVEFQMANDYPIPGRDYYSAKWVWEA